jgi:starvation-inducible DNA-binding protein
MPDTGSGPEIKAPLDPGVRADVVARLQATLVDLLDLTLQAKQAHWNVSGADLALIHQQLDEIVDTYREWSDSLAERIVALGAHPDGRPATIARTSGVHQLPSGGFDGAQVVGMLIERLSSAAARTRARMREPEPLDETSQDILVDVVKDLEEDLWMLQARRH